MRRCSASGFATENPAFLYQNRWIGMVIESVWLRKTLICWHHSSCCDHWSPTIQLRAAAGPLLAAGRQQRTLGADFAAVTGPSRAQPAERPAAPALAAGTPAIPSTSRASKVCASSERSYFRAQA